MKRFAAMMLTACLLCGLLAACTGEPPVTTAAPTTTEPTTVPPTTEEPTKNGVPTGWIIEEDTSIQGEITFATPFKRKQGVEAMIAEFNTVYPNVKVEVYTYGNNPDSSMAINPAWMMSEIDVIASFGLLQTYKRWENDMFMDITDLCAEEGIDLAQQWGTDAYTYNDRIYTFPCGGLSYYVAINMTAWKEAGYGELPTEWTWEEYMEACRKMTRYGEDGTTAVYGGSDYHSVHYFMFAYAQQYGGDLYYEADGTSSYDDPIMLESLERELNAELVEKIWFPKAVYRAEGHQAQMTFCTGVTASSITCNMVRFLHDTEAYPDVDWITGFAPFPVNEKGQTNYMSGVTPFSHAGISAYIEEEELPAAWAFLKWYATYGSKYLAVPGHQSNWKGTEPGELAALIYGSDEEAEKWIDLESFNRVVGRADLPAYAEITLTAYSQVTAARTDPIMQALNGETSAADALRMMAEEADAAIEAAK